jgi:outer membrane immunogenic protein
LAERGTNVKKLALLGAVIAALAFGAPAQAADAPIKGPYYKAAPVFSWTGFYFGGHIGYGWGEANVPAAGVVFDIDGFLGGAQLGYNWQVSPNWVFGIETDISASDIGAAGFNVDWFGTTRLRLGYSWDRMLLYVTGGLAYGGTNATSGHAGWAAGAGLEWAFAPRWSAKIEYLFVDLGDEILPLFAAPVSVDFSTIRFGVNYRF